MAGPWDKYQTAPAAEAPAAEGPWAKYRAPAPAAPAPKTEAPSSFATGVADPFVGINQAAQRAPPYSPSAGIMPQEEIAFGVDSPEARAQSGAAVDKQVQQRERDYQGQRAAAGEKGIDWGRLGGNVLSPANAPLMMVPGGAGTMLGRLFTGALAGGAGAMMEPAAGQNYGKEKAGQLALGAAAGAVLGPAGKLVEPIAKKGEDLLAGLWQQAIQGAPGALRDTRGSLNIPTFGGRSEGGIPGEAKPGVPAAPGGGVEPLPAGYGAGPQYGSAEMRQPPNLPIGGQAMPEAKPGIPAPPGGTVQAGGGAVPEFRQPPRLPLEGQALPEMSAGVAARPGGNAAGGRLTFDEYRQPPNLPISGHVPGEAMAGTPRPPGGTSQPSVLANAIANNDGNAIDQAMIRTYRQAIKPGKPMASPSRSALDTQDRRTMTAVDQIINNRATLTLTDAAGQEARGRLPQSIRQFAEALDHNKKSIFQQYDQMARGAEGASVSVDLAPVAAKLREISTRPAADLSPSAKAEALRLADLWESKTFTPSEAQDVIEHMNQSLRSFWRNPQMNETSSATLTAEASKVLREQLDGAIAGAQGPGYQALRHQYQALASVEKDVATALQRIANKDPSLASALADIGSVELLLHGVVSMNPSTVMHGAGLKAARAIQKAINDPNRAVKRMFEQRARTVSGYQPPVTPGWLPAMGGAAAGGGINQSIVPPR